MHLYRGSWRVLSRGDTFIPSTKRAVTSPAHLNALSNTAPAEGVKKYSTGQIYLTLIKRLISPRMAPPRPALEKQYMSSGTEPAKQVAEPRPSSSFVSLPPLPHLQHQLTSPRILLISPHNEILLLHRVRTSSSFPSAHVFPGGNLSASQDGHIPAPGSKERHIDGPAYRVGAIRECFEESGILLAKRGDGSGKLLEVPEEVREKGRKDVHSGKVKFLEWVREQGGVVDTGKYLLTKFLFPHLFSFLIFDFCL
jgi:8-oxo-dGTP pyrophosphatase MutT (NUDIX family)